MEKEFNQPVVMDKEGLKLTRNSKGYNWEIKITEIDVERLDKINEDMKSRYEIDGA